VYTGHRIASIYKLAVIDEHEANNMKKKLFSFSLILIILFFTSCEKPNKKENVKNYYWDKIEIITKNQKITIYSHNDTANVEIAKYKKISGIGMFAKYKLDKIENNKFYINKIERDSLYQNVFKVITKPTFTDKVATDYAGFILIKLKDRHTTIMCEYESVGEWSNISAETEKIYEIINPKTKLPK
jgi:hypothetical protein